MELGERPVASAGGMQASHDDGSESHPKRSATDLLVEAGRVLASTLDYEATICQGLGLFIPALADWCVIFLVDEARGVRVATIAHVDAESAERARTALGEYSSIDALPRSPFEVLRTGRSELLPHFPDEMLVEMAQDDAHLKMLRSADIRSSMTVPLAVRERLLGAISFISAESGRAYGSEDLALAEELGRRAAVAIDNAQLYQQARDAIRMRDEVMGIVAHDLRNPVATIRMAAEFIAEAGLVEDQGRRSLQLIVRSADRMNRLVADLLDVSSIEAGKLSVQLEAVDIGSVLEEVRDMFGAGTPAAQHEFYFDEGEGLVVQADRARCCRSSPTWWAMPSSSRPKTAPSPSG